MVADDDLLDYFTQLMDGAGAMLFGEYRIVVHPILAGHGPTLFQGLDRQRRLELVETQRLKSGVMAMHYRPKAG